MANKMLLIVTTGPEDRGNRATLAFSMGVAALISGVEAHIYLTMGGGLLVSPRVDQVGPD